MIKLYHSYEFGEIECGFKSILLPGGEFHIELESGGLTNYVIDARLSTPADFVELLTLTNALKESGAEIIHLRIPYFPGARQDRYQEGFAFTAKMYADLINQQNYTTVWMIDAHSLVTPALVHRSINDPGTRHIYKFINDHRIQGLVAPDLGASKKVKTLGEDTKLPVYQGTKERDSTTGNLSNFRLIDNALLNSRSDCPNLLVVDDICDGGGTFVMIGEYFKKYFPHIQLYLWVTHGIFSKGLDVLTPYYKRIGSTDSFPNNEANGFYYIKYKLEF